MSCDLLPTRSPGQHYQGDVRVIQDATAKQKHRGRDELLGWYRNGIGIELIEDDLLTWLRASSSRAAA